MALLWSRPYWGQLLGHHNPPEHHLDFATDEKSTVPTSLNIPSSRRPTSWLIMVMERNLPKMRHAAWEGCSSPETLNPISYLLYLRTASYTPSRSLSASTLVLSFTKSTCSLRAFYSVLTGTGRVGRTISVPLSSRSHLCSKDVSLLALLNTSWIGPPRVVLITVTISTGYFATLASSTQLSPLTLTVSYSIYDYHKPESVRIQSPAAWYGDEDSEGQEDVEEAVER